MSSQRGNVNRKGPPKHKNANAFKNTLHDKSKKTKELNEMTVSGLCARCKDIIDWKIKYKKYKPLTTSRKCVKCDQKTVKLAYHIICPPCATAASLCAKCGKAEEIVEGPEPTRAEKNAQHSQLTQDLKMLSERERRAFFRHVESGKKESDFPKLQREKDENFDDEDDLCDDDDFEDEEDT